MNNRVVRRRPDYGLDAPGICRGMFIAGGVGAVLAVGGFFLMKSSLLGAFGIVLGCLLFAYGTGMGTYMLWSSLVGKLLTRERLLEQVHTFRPWQGGETVLDVGCGRGLMLVGAAKRLTSGEAIGIDLWRSEDQAHNTPESALENARLEGVESQVRVETGDARDLSLSDASVDVVTSHWVVHNLPTPEDRIRAIDEMWRVLRPGGIIVLADIANMSQYVAHLESLGASRLELDNGGQFASVMGILSGGSFRPQSLIAQRSA